MEYIKEPGKNSEILRKESLNEIIFKVDVPGLKCWKTHGEPVTLAPDFKWEGKK